MSRKRRRDRTGIPATVIVWQNGIVQVFDRSGNPLPRLGGKIDRVGTALDRLLSSLHWRWRIWPGGNLFDDVWVRGRAMELTNCAVEASEASERARQERSAGRLLYAPMEIWDE